MNYIKKMARLLGLISARAYMKLYFKLVFTQQNVKVPHQKQMSLERLLYPNYASWN